MSVAFRRESDDEHLEPKFELPLPHGPNLVTPRGLRLIEERNAALEAALAATDDDEVRKALLRDARYWRQRLASAEVAPRPVGDRVAIGTRVTIELNGNSRTVEIVGHDESDPETGRIAFTAPLARALMGAEVDDEVDFAGSADPVLVTAIEAVARD
ncbi:GreA/GreB family elongation factor [Sphingomonas jaspsi]|uniref:GreA/GreB family elongation factor n=1 Tax=Sphingomonas jaspsi TaxID=392409 RepID=UPI0004B14414|nr:GreA/GreB family elongation factor [Sphingomonas jaspsi]